jgi:predicted DNA-binding transcriptional regulator AlpA
MTTTLNRWMTQAQLSEYLGGFSIRAIQKLQREGKIPVSYALGERSPRYDKVQIDAWMQQQNTASRDHQPRLAAG